eukprot:9498817-Pyramimonas_sp.AAC.2
MCVSPAVAMIGCFVRQILRQYWRRGCENVVLGLTIGNLFNARPELGPCYRYPNMSSMDNVLSNLLSNLCLPGLLMRTDNAGVIENGRAAEIYAC